MPQVAVRDGPFDGQEIAAAGSFRWISARGGHSAPAPGRALYKATPGGYQYVGNSTRWCPGCRASVDPTQQGTKTCPLCGTKTTPAYWPDKEE